MSDPDTAGREFKTGQPRPVACKPDSMPSHRSPLPVLLELAFLVLVRLLLL